MMLVKKTYNLDAVDIVRSDVARGTVERLRLKSEEKSVTIEDFEYVS